MATAAKSTTAKKAATTKVTPPKSVTDRRKAEAAAEVEPTIESPNGIVKVGRQWNVVVNGVTVETGLTQKRAQAALDERLAAVEPAEALPVEIPEDRVERLMLAKQEHVLLVEWRAGGQVGERPATPILDFYADPASVTRKAKRSSGSGSPRVVLDPAVEAKVVEAINARRRPAEGAPQSWTLVVKDLADAGVEYPGGGDWTRGRVRAVAKRLAMDVFGKEG